MKTKKTVPLSLRLSPELDQRLREVAEKLRLKHHSLAQEAIEAAVDAIEKNGYKLVVPVEFDVTHIPVLAKDARAGAVAGEILRKEASSVMAARPAGREYTSSAGESAESVSLNEPPGTPVQHPTAQTKAAYPPAQHTRTSRAGKPPKKGS